MDDKHRVLRAVFSDDKGTTKQINEVTCTHHLECENNHFLSSKSACGVMYVCRKSGGLKCLPYNACF